jgi:hypothetical protein
VCKSCKARNENCTPSTVARTNQITCLTCHHLKKGCSRVARYMLQKFEETWEKAELDIAAEDFYQWYPQVMRQQNLYIVQERDEIRAKKRASVKGKGKSKGKGKGGLYTATAFPSELQADSVGLRVSRTQIFWLCNTSIFPLTFSCLSGHFWSDLLVRWTFPLDDRWTFSKPAATVHWK